MMVKELPTEIWIMIAKKLKREPPSPGTKANWNDHLHQQDLVSLQRVSKVCKGPSDIADVGETIRINLACSLPYSNVQNLGLFLQGIQRPYDTNETAPCHKLILFDQIHMQVANDPTSDPDTAAEETYVVDRLGRLDLEGWGLADDIMTSYRSAESSEHRPPAISRKLKGLSFGVWDNGRWSTYLDRKTAYMGRDAEGLGFEDIYPVGYIQDILDQVFFDLHPRKAIDVCHYVGAAMRGPVGVISHSPYKATALRIIHDKKGVQLSFLSGPTRIYVRVDRLSFSSIDNHNLRHYISGLFNRYSSGIRLAGPQTNLQRRAGKSRLKGLDPMHVELCFLPDEAGNATHLRKAQQTKAGIEEFFASKATSNPFRKARLGKLDFFAGDEVPACPCCGLKG